MSPERLQVAQKRFQVTSKRFEMSQKRSQVTIKELFAFTLVPRYTWFKHALVELIREPQERSPWRGGAGVN